MVKFHGIISLPSQPTVGLEVARFLGVATSAVVRAANSEGLPEAENFC